MGCLVEVLKSIPANKLKKYLVAIANRKLTDKQMEIFQEIALRWAEDSYEEK